MICPHNGTAVLKELILLKDDRKRDAHTRTHTDGIQKHRPSVAVAKAQEFCGDCGCTVVTYARMMFAVWLLTCSHLDSCVLCVVRDHKTDANKILRRKDND